MYSQNLFPTVYVPIAIKCAAQGKDKGVSPGKPNLVPIVVVFNTFTTAVLEPLPRCEVTAINTLLNLIGNVLVPIT